MPRVSLNCAARCRGVLPSSSRALGSAPVPTRVAMTSGVVLTCAAACTGVHPCSFRAICLEDRTGHHPDTVSRQMSFQ